MKKQLTHVFSALSPFLELCPFDKIRMKSDALHILWTVHAVVLTFQIWIPHGKIANTYFFLSELFPFLELCPFDKIRMKSDACHIFEEVDGGGGGGILFSGCPCDRPSVRPSRFLIHLINRACYGFEISYTDSSWKNSWPTFFPHYLPFWSYALLIKLEWNLMHCISYEPCMLWFWHFRYGFLMEK